MLFGVVICFNCWLKCGKHLMGVRNDMKRLAYIITFCNEGTEVKQGIILPKFSFSTLLRAFDQSYFYF